VGEVWAVKVRFTARATAQITSALDYVAARSPQGAAKMRDRLTEITALLEALPYTGHATNMAGVRRVATIPYPYLMDYRVTDSAVIVMRFRHAARRPRG
jgi:toxin ParE1/3/4